MVSRLNPYLAFKDNAREAMEFYHTVFGGELTFSTFGEGGMLEDASESGLIMHAQLVTPSGYWLMASDTGKRMDIQAGNTVSLSLSGDDEAELRGYWEKLAAEGTITLPLEKAPWGDSFGMVADKYGFSWMVNISGAGR